VFEEPGHRKMKRSSKRPVAEAAEPTGLWRAEASKTTEKQAGYFTSKSASNRARGGGGGGGGGGGAEGGKFNARSGATGV